MKKKSKQKVSNDALVGIICNNILHESSRLSACEMRIMLQNAIDTNR
jgi:hypothetical protein